MAQNWIELDPLTGKPLNPVPPVSQPNWQDIVLPPEKGPIEKWESLWINKPLVEAPSRWGKEAGESIDMETLRRANTEGNQWDIGLNNPYMRGFASGALESFGNFVSGLTTPLNIATLGLFKGARSLAKTAPQAAKLMHMGGRALSAPIAGTGVGKVYSATTRPFQEGEGWGTRATEAGMGVTEAAMGLAGMAEPFHPVAKAKPVEPPPPPAPTSAALERISSVPDVPEGWLPFDTIPQDRPSIPETPPISPELPFGDEYQQGLPFGTYRSPRGRFTNTGPGLPTKTRPFLDEPLQQSLDFGEPPPPAPPKLPPPPAAPAPAPTSTTFPPTVSMPNWKKKDIAFWKNKGYKVSKLRSPEGWAVMIRGDMDPSTVTVPPAAVPEIPKVERVPGAMGANEIPYEEGTDVIIDDPDPSQTVIDKLAEEGLKPAGTTPDGKSIFRRFVEESKGSSEWEFWVIDWLKRKLRRQLGREPNEQEIGRGLAQAPFDPSVVDVPVIPDIEEAGMMDADTAKSFIEDARAAVDYWRKRQQEFAAENDPDGVKIAIRNGSQATTTLRTLLERTGDINPTVPPSPEQMDRAQHAALEHQRKSALVKPLWELIINDSNPRRYNEVDDLINTTTDRETLQQFVESLSEWKKEAMDSGDFQESEFLANLHENAWDRLAAIEGQGAPPGSLIPPDTQAKLDSGTDIVHPPNTAGFQHHVRPDGHWVTHPMFPEPKGPFPDADAAFDWALEVQDTPEFRRRLSPGAPDYLPPAEDKFGPQPEIQPRDKWDDPLPPFLKSLDGDQPPNIDIGPLRQQNVFGQQELPLGPHTELIPRELPVDYQVGGARPIDQLPHEGPQPEQLPLDFSKEKGLFRRFLEDESGSFDPEELAKNFKNLARIIWDNTDLHLAKGYFEQYDRWAKNLKRTPRDIQNKYDKLTQDIEFLPDGPQKQSALRQVEELLNEVDSTTGELKNKPTADEIESVGALRDEALDRWRHLKKGITEIPDVIKKFLEDETGAVPLSDIEGAAGKIKQRIRGVFKPGPKGEASTFEQAWGFPTSATTIGDVSGMGRQTFPLIFTPEWWKALGPMFRSLNANQAKIIDAELRKLPVYQRKRNTKTGAIIPSIAEKLNMPMIENGQVSRSEHNLGGNWVETGAFLGKASPLYAKSIGKYIAAPSNRAYATLLNHVRGHTLQKLMDTGRNMSIEAGEKGSIKARGMSGWLGAREKFTPTEAMELNPYKNEVLAREIADFINTVTGRAPAKFASILKGDDINLEPMMPFLRWGLFSPRNLFSKVRMLDPATYVMATPFVRKQYMKAAVSAGVAWWTLTQVARLHPAVTVSNDPNSADFWKIKVGKNVRLDPGGGFQQFLVALNRMLTGYVTPSTGGREYELGSGFRADTRETILRRFAANKLNPVAKFGYDLLAASERVPFHSLDRTAQLFLSLTAQDLYELIQEDPSLLPLMLPIVAGMGTQIYEKGESVGKIIPTRNDYLFKGGSLTEDLPDIWEGMFP